MVTRLPLRRRAVIHIRASGSAAIYLGHIFFSGQTISSSICHAGLFIGTLPLHTTVLVRHNFFFGKLIEHIFCVLWHVQPFDGRTLVCNAMVPLS